MPRTGNATRARIMDTAMTMFVEQGYDRTSLREIAEACGVTKAALYYYFRTKDEIVRAAIGEYGAAMSEIAEWLEAAPRRRETTVELVDRLLAVLGGSGTLAMRFTQANPTVLARDEFGERSIDVVRELVPRIAGPNPGADAMLRATLGIGALVLGSVPESPLGSLGDTESREAAARALALEILEPLAGD